MRWLWIDKFVAFESKVSASAVKAVTMAEEHLHDLYPGFPVVPHSLIVEGFAQTGGILVGEARRFTEKVILAKVGRARFERLVRPGDVLRFDVRMDQLTDQGASVSGRVSCDGETVAEIDMMFSHIDRNLQGLAFPEHNFVFDGQFLDLLRGVQMDGPVRI
ncbi:MAG: 3-hydroxyacyl-ACP dehydratase FabZ family protein [Tepidisphaerales bacterium]